MTLLHETLDRLAIAGKTPAEVEWVGAPDYGWATWDEFAAVADVEYEAGYGAPEVAMDLLVVGADWWLGREEYQGSEWWKYQTKPDRPERHLDLKRLVGGGYKTLEELNEAAA
jgi:hypothetical protein